MKVVAFYLSTLQTLELDGFSWSASILNVLLLLDAYAKGSSNIMKARLEDFNVSDKYTSGVESDVNIFLFQTKTRATRINGLTISNADGPDINATST